MSRFDNTVNSLLNHLIFEQTTVQLSDQDIQEAQNELQTIDSNFQKDPQKSIEVAQENIDSSDYIANALVEQFTDIKKNIEEEIVTEQTGPEWLQKTITDVKDYVKPYLKTAGGYIEGTFEKALDFLTDKLVEYVPSIMKGVIGEDTYTSLRTEVDDLDDRFWYKVIAIFDFTGIMSWPYLANAKKLYEEKLGTPDEDIYTLNLLAATVAVIPGVRALSIFTVPFKILRPLGKLIGGTRATVVAQAVARELKGALNIGQRMDRVTGLAARSGRITEKALAFARNVMKPVKAVAKLAASAAKAGTIMAAGDIPQMVRDWTKKGEEMTSQIRPQKTLMRIPSFQRLSTQD